MSKSVLACCGPILIFCFRGEKMKNVNRKIEITAEIKAVLENINTVTS
jgi:hypothetical protein